MRGMTLVSGGIAESCLDNSGGEKESEGGETNGKLHDDWQGGMYWQCVSSRL